jgi:protein-S-isoprenylcysteine O-methyltransferase Ste14
MSLLGPAKTWGRSSGNRDWGTDGVQSNMKNLRAKAFSGVIFLVVGLGVLIFLPAWTFNYWQAWVLLAVYGGANLAIIVALMVTDLKLLERRMRGGAIAERRPVQKIVMAIASLEFVALFVVSALDHHFGWSSMPLPFEILGDVLVAVGFLIIFFVFRVNTFTASTIEITEGQEVITTGPYAIVRHPMYSGSFLYMIGIPLALGSWWGLVVPLVGLFTTPWRLFDEEHMLEQGLPGYKEYEQKVRYRIAPYLW